jgi:hypothetical protein
MDDSHRRIPCLVLVLAFLLIAAACPTARADKIVMKNGNTFEGEILEERKDEIVLKMKFGTMSFKKTQIKSVIKSKYVPPTPPAKPDEKPETDQPAQPADPNRPRGGRPSKKAPEELVRLLSEADRAAKARDFQQAYELMKKAKDMAQAEAPDRVKSIEAKIKKLDEQALVVLDIKIEKLFVSENVRDPAVRGTRNAEPVSDGKARMEANTALTEAFERILTAKGFTPISAREGGRRRLQKLRITYSETGGPPYRDPEGRVVGHRLEVKVKLALLSPSGATRWSHDLQAVTPWALRRGTPRQVTIKLIQQQAAALSYGQ